MATEVPATAAIIGSGNIGTDLMFKLLRSTDLELRYVIGIDPDSEGLRLAAAQGLDTSAAGVDWLLDREELPDVVFDATSAQVHVRHEARLREAGLRVVDLTPAARGPYVVPTVNLREHLDQQSVNMVTCGGQATVPIVWAVRRVVPVEYAEIISTVASRSAGPGTRKNIDEFTRTTSKSLEVLGGAANGKAIIILNPAQPPIMMQNTIFCSLPDDASFEDVAASIQEVVAEVQAYVPGYRLRQEPQFDRRTAHQLGRVAVFLEVTGAGDYLPQYAGNLDIMTAAATKVGEEIARHIRTESRV
jgi:acetaldehyde dehydrogenase